MSVLVGRLLLATPWLLLAAHAGLLAFSAAQHSPTLLEPAFLVSGVSHWRLGRFELYRVNPPLPRMIAAAPLLVAGCNEDWARFDGQSGRRSEFAVGSDFMRANGPQSLDLLVMARWVCIPISLIGGYFAFRWSCELFGRAAGLLTLWLWTFEPNLAAHAELVTPDCAAWSLGIVAGYTFWRWLRHPTWTRATIAGLALGLAELTKFTWIVLFGLWPLLWLIWIRTTPQRSGVEPRANESEYAPSSPVDRHTRPPLRQLLAVLVLGLYVLNLGYLFDGTGTRLKSFTFVSSALSGSPDGDTFGNRFRDSVLGEIPVPLPGQYIQGIDAQARDFEQYRQRNYLSGEWKEGAGWWYYYLYGLLVKVPCGIWLLFLGSVGLRLIRSERLVEPRDEIVLLAPALTVLMICSTQTSINEHLRYVFPSLALALVWIGQVVRLAHRSADRARDALHRSTLVDGACRLIAPTLLALSCIWTAVAFAAAYPNHLAYFNEIAGGISAGSRHLLGSNLDWGQDLLLARKWCRAHGIDEPVTVLARCAIDPRDVGFDICDPAKQWDAVTGIRAGWYVVGESTRMGENVFVPAPDGKHVEVLSELVESLRSREPVARCGGALLVYRVKEQTPIGENVPIPFASRDLP